MLHYPPLPSRTNFAKKYEKFRIKNCYRSGGCCGRDLGDIIPPIRVSFSNDALTKFWIEELTVISWCCLLIGGIVLVICIIFGLPISITTNRYISDNDNDNRSIYHNSTSNGTGTVTATGTIEIVNQPANITKNSININSNYSSSSFTAIYFNPSNPGLYIGIISVFMISFSLFTCLKVEQCLKYLRLIQEFENFDSIPLAYYNHYYNEQDRENKKMLERIRSFAHESIIMSFNGNINLFGIVNDYLGKDVVICPRYSIDISS